MSIAEQIQQHTSRREDYVLLQRFSMPTEDGSRDAIAVTTEASKTLLSFYTLMVSVIAIHLWYLFVLVAIALAYRNKKLDLTRNHGVANVAIWNSQASPLSIIKSMFDYRRHIPKYASFWAFAAFLAWGASVTMSLLVSPQLIIGAAAPANLHSIYVPSVPESQQSSPYLRWWSLHVPAYLRAIEVLQAKDPKTGGAANTSDFDVVTQNPLRWNDSAGNDMYQVVYSYNITGVDFGLQHLPSLKLEVRGSCRTEYSWYLSDESGANKTTGVYMDWYMIFNKTEKVTNTDGSRPLTFAYLDEERTGSNLSFAFLTSSVTRRSYTQGSDPWYLTESLERDRFGAAYQVTSGRPPLSCWEESLMSNNKGPKKSMTELDQLRVLPNGLLDVLEDALNTPSIYRLTQALGNSALKSSQTSLGPYFDAATASIHSDPERLVLGAYFATRNTLAETTLFDDHYEDIPNLAFDQTTKQFKDGVADFVIYGSGFAALSVKVLIIVPVITVFLFVAVYLLTDNPFKALPWAYVNALKAPVLYSSLDNETFKVDSGDKWKRRSTMPHYAEKDQLALVRLKYERGGLSWGSSDQESGMQIKPFGPTPVSPREEKKAEPQPIEVK